MSARKNRRAKRKKKTQEDKIKKVKALLKPHPGKLSEPEPCPSVFTQTWSKIRTGTNILVHSLVQKLQTWYVIFRSDIIRTFKSSKCSIDWRSKTDNWFSTTSVAVQCRHKKHWAHCCYCPPNVWYDRISKVKTIKVHFIFCLSAWWLLFSTIGHFSVFAFFRPAVLFSVPFFMVQNRQKRILSKPQSSPQIKL